MNFMDMDMDINREEPYENEKFLIHEQFLTGCNGNSI